MLRLANRIRDDDLAMERALRLQKRQQGLDSSESSDSLTDEELDDQLRDKEISFKKDNWGNHLFVFSVLEIHVDN